MSSLQDETFEKIADQVFEKSLKQYEKDRDIDKSLIVTDKDFFDFVEKRVEAVRAHNERYTTELVKRIIDFYETRDQMRKENDQEK